MAECRGKKGKLKKMKEKYKDQDEEERQLKMQILQVSHHNRYCICSLYSLPVIYSVAESKPIYIITILTISLNFLTMV